MPTDEDIEKTKLRVEGAFKPLRCVAQVFDYKKKLSFKVFDKNDKGIVEMPNVSLDGLSSASNLEDIIQGVRREITAKGFGLT